MNSLSRLICVCFLSTFTCFAQEPTDLIVKHNGDRINAKVLSVDDAITYTFPNESAQIKISKNCVKEIVFASGRTQACSDKIVVNGRNDWQKVVITTDPDDVKGLVRKGDITTSANNAWNFKGAKGVDKKATEKIKKEAAILKAHIILLQDQTKRAGTLFKADTSSKSGVAYGYE